MANKSLSSNPQNLFSNPHTSSPSNDNPQPAPSPSSTNTPALIPTDSIPPPTPQTREPKRHSTPIPSISFSSEPLTVSLPASYKHPPPPQKRPETDIPPRHLCPTLLKYNALFYWTISNPFSPPNSSSPPSSSSSSQHRHLSPIILPKIQVMDDDPEEA
ncbi:uncharacterized protein [Palaemon carinicauda]|uniref:uncharacterized protein n=1 Tax=Palaemon carinicauda TaxID=392227 RepID=UPI0035B69BFF